MTETKGGGKYKGSDPKTVEFNSKISNAYNIGSLRAAVRGILDKEIRDKLIEAISNLETDPDHATEIKAQFGDYENVYDRAVEFLGIVPKDDDSKPEPEPEPKPKPDNEGGGESAGESVIFDKEDKTHIEDLVKGDILNKKLGDLDSKKDDVVFLNKYIKDIDSTISIDKLVEYLKEEGIEIEKNQRDHIKNTPFLRSMALFLRKELKRSAEEKIKALEAKSEVKLTELEIIDQFGVKIEGEELVFSRYSFYELDKTKKQIIGKPVKQIVPIIINSGYVIPRGDKTIMTKTVVIGDKKFEAGSDATGFHNKINEICKADNAKINEQLNAKKDGLPDRVLKRILTANNSGEVQEIFKLYVNGDPGHVKGPEKDIPLNDHEKSETIKIKQSFERFAEHNKKEDLEKIPEAGGLRAKINELIPTTEQIEKILSDKSKETVEKYKKTIEDSSSSEKYKPLLEHAKLDLEGKTLEAYIGELKMAIKDSDHKHNYFAKRTLNGDSAFTKSLFDKEKAELLAFIRSKLEALHKKDDDQTGPITFEQVQAAKDEWLKVMGEDKLKAGSGPARRLKRADMYRAEIDYKDLVKRFEAQAVASKDEASVANVSKLKESEAKPWYRRAKEFLVNRNLDQKKYYLRRAEEIKKYHNGEKTEVGFIGRQMLWWNSLPLVAKSGIIIATAVGTGGWAGMTPWLYGAASSGTGFFGTAGAYAASMVSTMSGGTLTGATAATIGAKAVVGSTVGTVFGAATNLSKERANRLLLDKDERSQASWSREERRAISERIKSGKGDRAKYQKELNSYGWEAAKGATVGAIAGGVGGAVYGVVDNQLGISQGIQSARTGIGSWVSNLLGLGNGTADVVVGGAGTAAVIPPQTGGSGAGQSVQVGQRVFAPFDLPSNARGGARGFFHREGLDFGNGIRKPGFIVDGVDKVINGRTVRGGKVSVWSTMQAMGMSEAQIDAVHKRHGGLLAEKMKLLIKAQFGNNPDLKLTRGGAEKLLKMSPDKLLHRLPEGLRIPLDIYNDVPGTRQVTLPTMNVGPRVVGPGTVVQPGGVTRPSGAFNPLLVGPKGSVAAGIPTGQQVPPVVGGNGSNAAAAVAAIQPTGSVQTPQLPELGSTRSYRNGLVVTKMGTVSLPPNMSWHDADSGIESNLSKIKFGNQSRVITDVTEQRALAIKNVLQTNGWVWPFTRTTEIPSVVGNAALGQGTIVVPSISESTPALVISQDSVIPANTVLPKGTQLLTETRGLISLSRDISVSSEISALNLSRSISDLGNGVYTVEPGSPRKVNLEYIESEEIKTEGNRSDDPNRKRQQSARDRLVAADTADWVKKNSDIYRSEKSEISTLTSSKMQALISVGVFPQAKNWEQIPFAELVKLRFKSSNEFSEFIRQFIINSTEFQNYNGKIKAGSRLAMLLEHGEITNKDGRIVIDRDSSLRRMFAGTDSDFKTLIDSISNSKGRLSYNLTEGKIEFIPNDTADAGGRITIINGSEGGSVGTATRATQLPLPMRAPDATGTGQSGDAVNRLKASPEAVDFVNKNRTFLLTASAEEIYALKADVLQEFINNHTLRFTSNDLMSVNLDEIFKVKLNENGLENFLNAVKTLHERVEQGRLSEVATIKAQELFESLLKVEKDGTIPLRNMFVGQGNEAQVITQFNSIVESIRSDGSPVFKVQNNGEILFAEPGAKPTAQKIASAGSRGEFDGVLAEARAKSVQLDTSEVARRFVDENPKYLIEAEGKTNLFEVFKFNKDYLQAYMSKGEGYYDYKILLQVNPEELAKVKLDAKGMKFFLEQLERFDRELISGQLDGEGEEDLERAVDLVKKLMNPGPDGKIPLREMFVGPGDKSQANTQFIELVEAIKLGEERAFTVSDKAGIQFVFDPSEESRRFVTYNPRLLIDIDQFTSRAASLKSGVIQLYLENDKYSSESLSYLDRQEIAKVKLKPEAMEKFLEQISLMIDSNALGLNEDRKSDVSKFADFLLEKGPDGKIPLREMFVADSATNRGVDEKFNKLVGELKSEEGKLLFEVLPDGNITYIGNK